MGCCASTEKPVRGVPLGYVADARAPPPPLYGIASPQTYPAPQTNPVPRPAQATRPAAPKGGALYVRQYQSHPAGDGITTQPNRQEQAAQARPALTSAFLQHVRVKMERDYILVIDRSGSMAGSRWRDAEAAVATLSRGICEFDPDGVTVIFFASDTRKFNNIAQADQIQQLFKQNVPGGSTKLADALDVAFAEHFAGTRGETSILVVTDGCPDSELDVRLVVERAAHSIMYDHELSVSFVQIGDDKPATRFLQLLDDELDTPFDIVDTMKATEMQNITFNELIKRSILD